MNVITLTEIDGLWYIERGKYWAWGKTIEDCADKLRNTYPPITLR